MHVLIVALGLMLFGAPANAELPPEAQRAFDRGMLAAQQQEWGVALQSFQDARRIAPPSPKIYYNLGLTESKIPGRELRAIAWLTAYLVANPDAPNAAAVIREIDALEVKSQSNLIRLVNAAANRESMEKVRQIVDLINPNFRNEAQTDLTNADLNLAKAQAGVGNSVAAVEMVKAASEAFTKSMVMPGMYEAINGIAEQFAQAGNFGAAVEVADLREPFADRWLSPSKKKGIWIDIYHEQMKVGDYVGASSTAERISTEESWKQQVQQAIASAKAKAATATDGSNAMMPASADAPAVSASDLINTVFGDGDDDKTKILNAPIFLNPTDYLASLSSADPHDVIKNFYPNKGIIGAEDWSSAGKPLVLLCALAQGAATMTEGVRVTGHYTKAVIAQTRAHASPLRQP